jgi:hypothetical protein
MDGFGIAGAVIWVTGTMMGISKTVLGIAGTVGRITWSIMGVIVCVMLMVGITRSRISPWP